MHQPNLWRLSKNFTSTPHYLNEPLRECGRASVIVELNETSCGMRLVEVL